MKKITLGLFLLACLLQWLVPLQMIWQQESIRSNGQVFKLKTVPVDPNDPFRGKYITLNFDINQYTTRDLGDLTENTIGQEVFVVLNKDEEGYAAIEKVTKFPPKHTSNYLNAKIAYSNAKEGAYRIRLSYPFQQFFLEESKAQKAEDLYRDVLRDSDKKVYALVKVQKGYASLMDVQVDGISIKDVVNEMVETNDNIE